MSGSCRPSRRFARGLSVFAAAVTVATATVSALLGPVAPAGATTTTCAPSVAMYHIDGLAQLRRWSYAAPLDGSSGWTEQQIGSGWNGLNVVSGGSGVLYAIDGAGHLRWYQDEGFGGVGGALWNPASGSVIGYGWGGFTSVVSGGHGVIYAVDTAGNLRWYRYLGTDGSLIWDGRSGTVIGTGWGGLTLVPGGAGVIFAEDGAGFLRWYRQVDPFTPSAGWVNGGTGSIVGSGWSSFSRIGSMGGGVLFARMVNGGLMWYRDLDPMGGTATWANGGSGVNEGTGWNNSAVLTDIEACTAS